MIVHATHAALGILYTYTHDVAMSPDNIRTKLPTCVLTVCSTLTESVMPASLVALDPSSSSYDAAKESCTGTNMS